MLEHIGFPVRDLLRSRQFYLAALAPLDIDIVKEVTPEQTGGHAAVGFGAQRKPFFWIGDGQTFSGSVHIAFAAKDRDGRRILSRGDRGRRHRQWRAGHQGALSSELLWRLRPRSRRAQYRGDVPHGGMKLCPR